jgi:hypothetical protein
MIFEGAHGYRTGEVAHTYKHQTLQWWEEIPLGVGAVLVGGLLAWGKTPPSK